MADRRKAQASGEQRRELQQRIAQIRKASFETTRKGYDQAQVRHFLDAVADWLEDLGLGDADRGEMRRELAWVGERTSEILTKAEETASELREQGESEARKLRAEAHEESRRVREEAATEAQELVTSAEQKAAAILEDANRRREDLQSLVGDLLMRRDEIVADGVRLAEELTELFGTTVDASELGDQLAADDTGALEGDEAEGDEAEGDDGEPTRRFDPVALDEAGDEYDEDGVRIPRDDDAPAPMRTNAGDEPDAEERASRHR